MTAVQSPIREQVADKVQQALDRHQPRKYRVSVDPAGIVRDGDWYHIVVKSPDDARDRDFYDALADAEADLNDLNDGFQYLLVPAIA